MQKFTICLSHNLHAPILYVHLLTCVYAYMYRSDLISKLNQRKQRYIRMYVNLFNNVDSIMLYIIKLCENNITYVYQHFVSRYVCTLQHGCKLWTTKDVFIKILVICLTAKLNYCQYYTMCP